MKQQTMPIESWMTQKLSEQYHYAENEQYRVWYTGILAYKTDGGTVYDVLDIAHMAISHTLDFNQLLGFYKIVIEEKSTKALTFWGDHSGSQRFYITSSATMFSDSLPGCIQKNPGNILPDYCAIVQYFALGRTIDDSTIVSGIRKTNTEQYYTLIEHKLCNHTKGLLRFSEMEHPYSLHEVVEALAGGLAPEELSAVATGGTDSRAILAHLIHLGYHPELLITGREQNKDVQIAQEIAHCVSAPLHVYNPAGKEENWLQRAYEFSNGIYDVALSYRHLRKAEMSKQAGLSYEFGGVGGEFYKNIFFLPFRNSVYGQTVSLQRVFEDLIGKRICKSAWFGTDLSAEVEHTKSQLLDLLQSDVEPGVLRSYNKIGFRLLSGGFCNITENIVPYTTKIDPLMDRNVIAGVCRQSPLSLCMARWQRKEIRGYCPQLSNLPTDQGYTCSMNPFALWGESVKKLLFYGKLAVGRIRRVVFHQQKRKTQLWDQDYQEAAKSPEYQKSFQLCQSMGVLSTEMMPQDIPLNMVGVVLMIGMTFSQIEAVD